MITAAPLRKYLVEHDMTLMELSEVTGLSYSTVVSMVNKDICLTVGNVSKICEVLRIQPCDVMEYKGSKVEQLKSIIDKMSEEEKNELINSLSRHFS